MTWSIFTHILLFICMCNDSEDFQEILPLYLMVLTETCHKISSAAQKIGTGVILDKKITGKFLNSRLT